MAESQTTTEPTLEQCPLCPDGGKPYFTKTVNGTNMAYVGCGQCGVQLKAQVQFLSSREDWTLSKDIVAIWNTRPRVSASVAPPVANLEAWTSIDVWLRDNPNATAAECLAELVKRIKIEAPIVAPEVDAPLLPQTDYKTKPQLDGNERYKFGHLFHEYTFNNCDHGEQVGRVCKGCVAECLAYLAQRRAPASTVAPQTKSCGFCGKSDQEVKALIQAPAGYICEECVAICAGIIERNGVAPQEQSDAPTRQYFCSYGGALTAEEYIEHYFEKGHDRGEPALLAKAAAAEIYDLDQPTLDQIQSVILKRCFSTEGEDTK